MHFWTGKGWFKADTDWQLKIMGPYFISKSVSAVCPVIAFPFLVTPCTTPMQTRTPHFCRNFHSHPFVTAKNDRVRSVHWFQFASCNFTPSALNVYPETVVLLRFLAATYHADPLLSMHPDGFQRGGNARKHKKQNVAKRTIYAHRMPSLVLIFSFHLISQPPRSTGRAQEGNGNTDTHRHILRGLN